MTDMIETPRPPASRAANPRRRVVGALAAVAAAVAVGAALVHGRATDADSIELVTFHSGSYADFRQVFAREAPVRVAVPATLRFPGRPRERSPAVVVVHTIGGFQEANEGWQAAEFRRNGFATLTYDSFSARGLRQAAVVGSRTGPPLASGVADAFAALHLLAGHPRIAADRIGIAGFSFGGEVAHLTAFEALRSVMAPDSARFAAHVATYPGGSYGARAEEGAYTGAPILMLLGENDDNLPVTKVEGYLAYASAAGHPAPITTAVYPGAFHAWTVPTLGAPRFYAQYLSTRKCPVILFGRGAPTWLVDGREQALDMDAVTACVAAGPGYTMAFNATARTKSTADTVGFLQRHLR
jgi:dienelactone hydrolase